jgi:hypothetical protein
MDLAIEFAPSSEYPAGARLKSSDSSIIDAYAVNKNYRFPTLPADFYTSHTGRAAHHAELDGATGPRNPGRTAASI